MLEVGTEFLYKANEVVGPKRKKKEKKKSNDYLSPF